MGTQSIFLFCVSGIARLLTIIYLRREWPLKQVLKRGLHNVQSHPLIEPNKILLPPLDIKLGVIKNFMKAIDREGSRFAFLQKFLLKLKAGIFDGLQIRELMKGPIFDEVLNKAELSFRQSLKSLTNFLGNYWSAEQEKGIEDLLKSFCQLGA